MVYPLYRGCPKRFYIDRGDKIWGFSFVHCGEVFNTVSLYRRVLFERFHWTTVGLIIERLPRNVKGGGYSDATLQLEKRIFPMRFVTYKDIEFVTIMLCHANIKKKSATGGEEKLKRSKGSKWRRHCHF